MSGYKIDEKWLYNGTSLVSKYTNSLVGNGSYLKIGTATTGHSLSATNDLLIGGKLEVDGVSYFDTDVYIASTIYSASGSQKLYMDDQGTTNGGNVIFGYYGASIEAGYGNTIVGGGYNLSSDYQNKITGNSNLRTIIGGYDNEIKAALASSILGSMHSDIDASVTHSNIYGGSYHHIVFDGATILTTDYSIILGGSTNHLTGDLSGMVAGSTNTILGDQNFMAGGSGSTYNGNYGSIIAGVNCSVTGNRSGWFIPNGNTSYGNDFIGIGGQNHTAGVVSTTYASFSVMSGGSGSQLGTTSTSRYSAMIACRDCVHNGEYGFIHGYAVTSTGAGITALTDSSSSAYAISTANSFNTRFSGGHYFYGGDSTATSLYISSYHNTEATSSSLYFRKADNTRASPAAIDTNAVLGTIYFQGHDGSAFASGAVIYAKADADWSGSERGTALYIQTRDGSGALTDAMMISAAANVYIGTTDNDGTPAIGRLVVKGTTNDGTTNIIVGRDSDEANVFYVDTNGGVALTSMLTNWTNAGRTVADMGTVTTIDINGGSIDGVTIGAASASTATFTTLTINTGIVPDADDGAYLGTGTTAFSDLFLADGGVINWNNGNVTLTHSSGTLTTNAKVNITTSAPADTSLVINAGTVGNPITTAIKAMSIDWTGGYAAGFTPVENLKITSTGFSLGTAIFGYTAEYAGHASDAAGSYVALFTTGTIAKNTGSATVVAYTSTSVLAGGVAPDVTYSAINEDLIIQPIWLMSEHAGTTTKIYGGSAFSTGGDVNGGDLELYGGVAGGAGTTGNVIIKTGWSANGVTCSDLGSVTTADINGGTIDGVTIGGSVAGAITGTTITANTGLVPDANDGAYLGQAGTAFSDLFLASGGVINWDSSNYTLTHSTGLLTASGALTVSGVLTTESGIINNVTDVNAATYDLLTTDYILHVSYTATGAVTSLTLPTAQCVEGRTIIIKDAAGNASTYSITIDTEGSEKIDGEDTLTINADYNSVTLYSNGSNWFII